MDRFRTTLPGRTSLAKSAMARGRFGLHLVEGIELHTDVVRYESLVVSHVEVISRHPHTVLETVFQPCSNCVREPLPRLLGVDVQNVQRVLKFVRNIHPPIVPRR